MIKLSREDIKYLLKVVIFVALIVLAIRFFIYILPLIILALVIMLLYDFYERKKKESNIKKADEKDRKNKVMDAEIINEKKVD